MISSLITSGRALFHDYIRQNIGCSLLDLWPTSIFTSNDGISPFWHYAMLRHEIN